MGWLDVTASHELGMLLPPALAMNDAEAAALGEWILHGEPEGLTLYVGIGTGVGAVGVESGEIVPVEFGHLTSFGPKTCQGCGRVGCLDAQIGGHALPTPLDPSSQEMVAEVLAAAIAQQPAPVDRVVLAGGVVRANPEILARLRRTVNADVLGSACPSPYKSAAFWGLLHRWASTSSANVTAHRTEGNDRA